MRTAVRYFGGLAVFAFVLTAIYWFRTREWAGTLLLAFFGIVPSILVAWSIVHGRTRESMTSDDPDATPQQAAGEAIGSFPMVSAWPVFFVLGTVVAAAGLVYGLILVPAGAAVMVWAVVGLMRESRS
jgi:hypothetical protein